MSNEEADEYGQIDVFASAHISPEHINEVRQRIDEGDYDVVAIELDESRFERAVAGRPPTPMEILDEMDGVNAVVYALLAFVQRLQARRVGIEPGLSDMRAAMEAAALDETPVALIDRDISVTINRLMDRVNVQTVINQLFNMDPEIAEEMQDLRGMDFKEMTTEDSAKQFVGTMRKAFPEFTEVFIDERDHYMAERLHQLRLDGKDVFAVVGAGHTPGLEQHLDDLAVTGRDPDVDVIIKQLRATGNDVDSRDVDNEYNEDNDYDV